MLLRAEPRPVDTVEVTSAVHDRTVVLGSVYAGVDAVANRHANTTRLLRGAASYYAGAVRAVAGWRATRYRVTVDGEEHAFTGYTVVAANSGYYGFDRLIAPSARVDDGLLDVVMIHQAPRRLFFALMNELSNWAPTSTGPRYASCAALEVRIEAGPGDTLRRRRRGRGRRASHRQGAARRAARPVLNTPAGAGRPSAPGPTARRISPVAW
ncbi:hypothetical protein SVIOM342S_09663 [Streptomyces violaceorubidus]